MRILMLAMMLITSYEMVRVVTKHPEPKQQDKGI